MYWIRKYRPQIYLNVYGSLECPMEASQHTMSGAIIHVGDYVRHKSSVYIY